MWSCRIYVVFLVFRKLYRLDATVKHRYEKRDVKLNVGQVFFQKFNRDVFDWFAGGN